MIAVTARWMPEPTPIEVMIKAAQRADEARPVARQAPAYERRALITARPAPAVQADDNNGRSRHPAAIAAQERRRIARLAQRTREANEAARRRAHRLALEASMQTDQGDD